MKIVNRKFEREYEEIEAYEAGIVLSGAEVKQIRSGALRLDEAHVRLLDGQAYLINAEIPPYRFATQKEYDPKRSRKLLLHRDELVRISTKMKGSGGLTVAPISCYNKGSRIKLKIALVRARKDLEKRKLEKQKKLKRDQQREVKEYLR